MVASRPLQAILVLAAAAAPACLSAQGAAPVRPAQARASAQPAQARASAQQETPEEIVVRGRRSLHALRLDVQDARERIYELFNALNTDDDLDIHCSYETRIDSHFKERVCRARYADDAAGRAGREVAQFIQSECPLGLTSCNAEAVFSNANSIVQDDYKRVPQMDLRLDREMQRLARENPEIAAAIEEYRAKERAYRDAADERAKHRRE